MTEWQPWEFFTCPNCNKDLDYGFDTPFTIKWGKQPACGKCRVSIDWGMNNDPLS